MVIILVKLWYPKSNKVQNLITVRAKHPNCIVCLRHSYQENIAVWKINIYLRLSCLMKKLDRLLKAVFGIQSTSGIQNQVVCWFTRWRCRFSRNNWIHSTTTAIVSPTSIYYFHSRVKIKLLITLFVTGQMVIKNLN